MDGKRGGVLVAGLAAAVAAVGGLNLIPTVYSAAHNSAKWRKGSLNNPRAGFASVAARDKYIRKMERQGRGYTQADVRLAPGAV